MLNRDQDDLFSDIAEVGAEEAAFLENLREVLPGTLFQLRQDSGAMHGDGLATMSEEMAAGLLATARQAGRGWMPDGEGRDRWVAVPIPRMKGILLADLAGFVPACGASGALATLVDDCARHALLKSGQEEIRAESEQYRRQIDSLLQQHHELLESNHRQYLQLQEQEREYAKRLESDIARRTAELRKANEELQVASRLKSEFLANMSHELRTPMNAILGFAELLAETELSPTQADYASTIRQSAGGLLSLINDILDFAKIEAGKLDIFAAPFSLQLLMKNIHAMFTGRAREKGNVFSCHLAPQLSGNVVGDENRIRQILVNLVGNAMKFTEQGEVWVGAEPAGDGAPPDLVRFTVHDTGIGIPLDRQAAVFEKFTQADGSTTRKYGGTGLGLAISSQLVQLMKGRIHLRSTPGEGSTFIVELPLSAEPEKRPASAVPAPAPAEEARPAGLRVLLVEDNLVNQKLATVLLQKEGCGVTVAADGLQALERVKDGEFDLVFMDLQMPNMGGLEATLRIRELERGSDRESYRALAGRSTPLPIVGLSAHARREDAEEGLAAGMNDFLTKPIVKNKLLEVLQGIRRQVTNSTSSV